MSTIPASAFVNVTPNVLAAGGNALDVIGLMLTTSARPPIGQVVSFGDAASVGDYFGSGSNEKTCADKYFGGFEGSSVKPGAFLIAQYPASAVAAFARGGNVSALTLAQLQAISGSLTMTIDGAAFVASSINLSSATSFSSAATIIQTGLQNAAPADASVTGSIGGSVTARMGAAFTGSGSGTNLTTTSVTGVIHPGDIVAGTGVPGGTAIVSQTSGTPGGAGVYVTSAATTSSSDSLTTTSEILDVTAVGSGSIQTGDVLSGSGVTVDTAVVDQLSGATGGVGTYLVSATQSFSSTTVASLSTVLKVTAVGSGSLGVGSPIAGTNITVGTKITAVLTGSGGVGTYRVDHAATTVSETITSTVNLPTVAYDSVSGAFVVTSGSTGAASTISYATGTISAALALTSATGAVISQGAASAAPGTFMDGVVATNQDWVSFFTAFDPDNSGNDNKYAFAVWCDAQNKRYAYVAWDTDVAPSASAPAASSLGHRISAAGLSGTFVIGRDAADTVDQTYAAFVAGIGASIDFEEQNGRTTYAYRSQSGLLPTCTDLTAYNNLKANGYNCYAAVATANSQFQFLQPGSVSGPFLWMDSYIDQIWLNNGLQLALLGLMAAAKSVPYNIAGRTQIEAACADPINAAVNFGAIRAGVALSSSQASAVNAAAGVKISGTLTERGWYLQVKDPSALVRQARGSTVNKFWYTDGQSVQVIDLDSTEIV